MERVEHRSFRGSKAQMVFVGITANLMHIWPDFGRVFHCGVLCYNKYGRHIPVLLPTTLKSTVLFNVVFYYKPSHHASWNVKGVG